MKLKNDRTGRVIELKLKEKNYIPMGKRWKIAMGNAAKRNLNKA